MNLIRLITLQHRSRCLSKQAFSRPPAATIAIVFVAILLEPYITDVLMRDLVGHDRSPAAFLVYLQLYRLTHGAGKRAVPVSYASLAEVAGLSKRTAQMAVAHLKARRLIQIDQASPTAVPVYTVLRPWIRRTIPSS